ncbi:MAG: hypothetical protein NTX53_09565, partial [candidate division WOR-3 bacterium]|nr:hypothetical protein [candidate division WOR-3 bacterium]
MKNKERGAATVVVVLLLTTGISMAQVAGPDAMMKGIEFTRASSMKPYNSSEAYQSLKLAQAAGANWVTIVPVYWMSDTGAPNVFWMDDQSPSDDEVRQVVRWAKQLSLKVFMKPEVHCLSGVWQGYHNPHSATWFLSYWSFIRRYARIAQEEECEMLCVGSELDRTTDSTWEPNQWTQIINWVKGEYLGPITYAADWRTYRSIPFWDSLDYIGINAYFGPLVSSPTGPTDVQSLAEEWKYDLIPAIEAFRDSLNLSDSVKPI